MKKVIYILFVTIFTLLVVNVSKETQSRVHFEINNFGHSKQIDFTKKIVAECNDDENLYISVADENKLELGKFIFDTTFFREFLLKYFNKNKLKNSLKINYTIAGQFLPKYILYNSLRVDYI